MCLSTAEILQANDSLTQVINLYRQLVKGEEVNGDTSNTAGLPGTAQMSAMSLEMLSLIEIVIKDC